MSHLRELLKIKIGPIPLYLAILIAGVVFFAAKEQDLSNDMIGGLAAMMVAGYLLRELGARLPGLNLIGGSAILCIFIPSMMVGYQLVQHPTLEAISTTMKTSNFMYLFLSCLIVGSILGVDRKMLIHGFSRISIPLLIGSIVASLFGIITAWLLGRSVWDAFFFIVVPILSGGIAEGVLPLAIAYSEILGINDQELLAKIIPAPLIANVFAILCAGILYQIGKKWPSFSGNGSLLFGIAPLASKENEHNKVDIQVMGAGLLVICALFTFGGLLAPYVHLPGVIVMILAVTILKYLNFFPEEVDRGAYAMYQFMSQNLTPAVLVGVGMLFVPWNSLVSALSWDYVLICFATVIGMVLSTFLIAKFLKLYPVECAVVCATHSGLGGTGDIAILSAANRMGLMPFASMATRIGGVLMIIFSTFLIRSI